jgi:hypothetical protein
LCGTNLTGFQKKVAIKKSNEEWRRMKKKQERNKEIKKRNKKERKK